jgi:hypothetical protein
MTFTKVKARQALSHIRNGSLRDLEDLLRDIVDGVAPAEVVSAANVITADESGTTYFLDLAGGFASTLPAPALGLRFKFVVKTAPTTAYTIVTNASSNVIMGGLTESAAATGAVDTNGDTISFVANTALPGDWVELISDGTNWYLTGGNAAADGGIALSTAS